MSTCQVSKGHKLATAIQAVMMLLLFLTVSDAPACFCVWEEPFLNIATQSPLIVHGRVLRHHGGSQPTMDILVLETLKGGLLDTGLQIQMGDGIFCRPDKRDFPVGTEWFFALNGNDKKSGQGWALSRCGESWLKVENDRAFGGHITISAIH